MPDLVSLALTAADFLSSVAIVFYVAAKTIRAIFDPGEGVPPHD